MGKRDELYKLTDAVELDEGFFTTEVEDDEKDKPLKVGHLKMIVINDLLSGTIDSVTK